MKLWRSQPLRVRQSAGDGVVAMVLYPVSYALASHHLPQWWFVPLTGVLTFALGYVTFGLRLRLRRRVR